MNIKYFITLLISTTLLALNSNQTVFDFEDVKVGKLPHMWLKDATGDKKHLASWEVVKDKEQKYLSLTHINSNSRSSFNLCYTKNIEFKDGTISVKFKANSGETDQGGGIMWRVHDSGNYYVARFNPLEDNFRFYKVKNSVRSMISSANIKLESGWHVMKIVQKGTHFEGYLNGQKLLESDDDSFKKSGGVGVWTKADAATSFDDFIVEVDR
jgi:hypothetical protein